MTPLNELKALAKAVYSPLKDGMKDSGLKEGCKLYAVKETTE